MVTMKWLCLLFTLILLALPVNAGAEPVVSIQPASGTVKTSQSLSVNININEASGLYGFQFDLIYDPGFFTITGTSEGSFLSQDIPGSTFCIFGDASTEGQLSNLACTRIIPGELSGNGTLATVKLTPKGKTGTTQLSLGNVKLSGSHSSPIAHTILGSEITVIKQEASSNRRSGSRGGGCYPNWLCTAWSDCGPGGNQTRTCTDQNACGTETNKPPESQACEYSEPPECQEDWSCTDWSQCSDGQQTRTCTDQNACGTERHKPGEIQACSQGPEPGAQAGPPTGLFLEPASMIYIYLFIVIIPFIVALAWKSRLP